MSLCVTLPDRLYDGRTNELPTWAALAELAFTRSSTRRLIWDPSTRSARTQAIHLTPAEAFSDGLPHTALTRAGWVAIDADANVGRAGLAAIAYAAAQLGITVGGSPSGSITNGVEHLTLIAHTGTAAHTGAFVAIVKRELGNLGGVRQGQGTRPPGSPTYKPHHDPARAARAVILDERGAVRPTTVDALIEALETPSPLPVEALPEILTRIGVDPDAASTTIVPTRSPGASPRELFEALPGFLRGIAMTHGAGYGRDPQSRSEGQFRVVRSLIRKGYTDADIRGFLAAFPIGERPCRPEQVRESLERWGDTVITEPHIEVADRFWRRLHGSPTQLVTGAAAAHIIARAGTSFDLSERQASELTGLDRKTVRKALRELTGLTVATAGDLESPTHWAYDPRRGGRPHSAQHRPHWSTVVEVARSDAAQGGAIGAGEILTLAAVQTGASTVAEIARAFEVPERTAGRWVRSLRGAGVLAAYDSSAPAAPLTVVQTLDRALRAHDGAANAVRDRHQAEREAHRAELKRRTAAFHERMRAMTGDPGIAAPVVEPELVCPQGAEDLWDAVWLKLDLPGIDVGWELDRDALATGITVKGLEYAAGDLGVTERAAVAAAEAVTAWAWAGVDRAREAGAAMAVAVQAIEAVLDGSDASAVLAAAAEAGAARTSRLVVATSVPLAPVIALAPRERRPDLVAA